MNIFPAIDLYEGCAVRLLQGDYDKKTVYSSDPLEVAREFAACGAEYIHLVDLEGAKTGETPNIDVMMRIREDVGLFVEVGGGIRSIATVKRYMDAGIDRVILGTAAVNDPDFAEEAARLYLGRVAVGADIKDGFVAIKGWTEKSGLIVYDFLGDMSKRGIDTVICTDISKDGMLQGANTELYAGLSERFSGMKIIASGGVSSMEDIKTLCDMDLYGAIIGKAYYEKKIDLKEAIEYCRKR